MGFPEHLDHRLYVPWPGVVVRNDDPEGLHRVTVRVPGFIEETGWAFPLTAGGGAPQRGGHIMPEVGSDVVVWFLGGDEERPVYQAAHWGIRSDSGKETPLSMRDAGENAHLVQSLQVGPLLFTIDERPRSDNGEGERFTITDLNANKVVLEYDFKLQGWTIEADYLVQIRAGGILRLDGLQVQAAGRLVKRGTVRQL